MEEIPISQKKEIYTPALKGIDNITCQLSHWRNRHQFKSLRQSDGPYSLKGFDELECIFIHIPKAAGVSINKVLFGNLGGAHRSVRSYKRIFGPKTFQRYFKFTFVRNPYSRLLSAFRFLKQGGFNPKDELWAKKHLAEYDTFTEFVNEWLTDKTMMEYIHFHPQCMFVCDRTLEPEVDFIGRFETLEADFNTICKRLNISQELEKHNQSQKKSVDWRTAYTDETQEKVYRLYQKDFEIFGYSPEFP